MALKELFLFLYRLKMSKNYAFLVKNIYLTGAFKRFRKIASCCSASFLQSELFAKKMYLKFTPIKLREVVWLEIVETFLAFFFDVYRSPFEVGFF